MTFFRRTYIAVYPVPTMRYVVDKDTSPLSSSPPNAGISIFCPAFTSGPKTFVVLNCLVLLACEFIFFLGILAMHLGNACSKRPDPSFPISMNSVSRGRWALRVGAPGNREHFPKTMFRSGFNPVLVGRDSFQRTYSLHCKALEVQTGQERRWLNNQWLHPLASASSKHRTPAMLWF